MDQDRRFTAAFTGSRLAAQLSARVSLLEAAWRHSAARTGAARATACLADRRSGSATMAVAATVALAAQQLRPTTEPAEWMLPAFVLLWAAASLLWTRGRE